MLMNNSLSKQFVNNTKLAWHFYQQEYQQNHQKLLRWVQGVLLLFIVTLSQSSANIQHFLEHNLQGLLGADAVISQKGALTYPQLNTLAAFSDEIVTTAQVKTMLTHQGQWQQTLLKAVDEQYPLQGELITSSTLQGEGEPRTTGPKSGDIWLDSRLVASLSITLGETLLVAGQPFMVTNIIQHEPDRLMEGHSVDMRAMINAKDLPMLSFSDDLIQYRYLLAAGEQQIAQLIQWQQEQLPAAQVQHKQGQHPLALFWQRVENFIGLASILLFFMSAIAVMQLAQVQMKKDQYFSAICMSLGASKAAGIQVSVLKWLINIVLLLPCVLLLSAGFHYLIIDFLNNTFAELTWQWEILAVIKPIGAVFAIFAIFHAPVWISLLQSTVAKQFNGSGTNVNPWLNKLSSALALSVVALIYSDNGLLTTMMFLAIALTIVLMMVICWLSLTLGEKATQRVSGLMPFALFMMRQRLVSKSTQILGIGLCAFLLLFTLMFLSDLGSTMTQYQRQHDGNVFVSQANSEQMNFIDAWAKENEITIRQVKPYMHAKLIAINNQSLKDFSDKPSDSMSTFSRSIRLHWSDAIPENNRLVDGQWWQDDKTSQKGDNNWQQISVEQEVMTDLGLSLGDKLSFYINQKSYQFEIVASHEFKAGAGSITFWVQMPPSALANIQASYYHMASLELKDQQWELLTPLWQKFPTLRMVSLKEITQLFDQTLSMVTKVIGGFSVMIIILAIVVILASIQALASKEQKKNSIILSFGFSRLTCLKLNVIEWLFTAGIAAVGAIAGTYIAGLLVYQSQFSLTYQPSVTWLAGTLLIILSLITALGVYASHHHLRSSVRQLLASD